MSNSISENGPWSPLTVGQSGAMAAQHSRQSSALLQLPPTICGVRPRYTTARAGCTLGTIVAPCHENIGGGGQKRCSSAMY